MKDPIGSETLDVMSKADQYNDYLFSLFRKYLHGDILEVGCGKGIFTQKLIKYGRVTALDFNREYIKLLKRKFGNRVFVGFGDVEKDKYFFKNSKFDVIINLNVLEHINDDEKALKNMYRLLKPDGVLILLTPAHQWNYTQLDKGLGHFRRYTKTKLISMFENTGFNVMKCHYLNWIGALGWFFSGKILKRKVIPGGQLGLFDKFGVYIVKLERLISPPFGLSVFIVGKK